MALLISDARLHTDSKREATTAVSVSQLSLRCRHEGWVSAEPHQCPGKAAGGHG